MSSDHNSATSSQTSPHETTSIVGGSFAAAPAPRKEWNVKASVVSMRTSNPIRRIVDQMQLAPNPSKKLISLSIGDPTVFGNMKTPESVTQAVVKTVTSYSYNGYPHSCGYPAARDAVARKYSLPQAPLTTNDIILCSGASHSLDLCISVLADEGDNILLPTPGFSLYQTLCDSKGINCKFYNLLPEKDWDADLSHMRSLIDERTRAILINNPSNPCGCVYSKEHLLEIARIAEEFRLPIIADEIYADMAFEGSVFHPMASLTSTVPVLAVGGIAKQYLVPGWRLGWVLIHDRNDAFKEVRDGLLRLTTLILGSSSLVQSALPEILHHTDAQFYTDLNAQLAAQARYSVERISKIKGLNIIVPKGAMYVMTEIKIDEFKDIEDDVDFSRKLLQEESVLVLPGQAFRAKNFFRIVFCPPMDKLCDAYDRLEEFCERHRK